MSKYADVYLLPIAEDKVDQYKKIAKMAGKVFMKHGALKYREYVMSDPKAEGLIPFPKALKLKPGETVIYAAVEFKSEAHRNSARKRIMADSEMDPGDKPMPFDFRRMVYGGFKVIVDL
jgi:uncharacterized protein YbaA (DUF1428 family)